MTAAYEKSDAKARSLLIFTAGLVALLVASFLVGAWMMGAFEATSEQKEEPNPLEAYRAKATAPLLQANPSLEIEAYRVEIQELLETYGWVDRPGGIARVPLESAVERVLEQGFPTRANPVDPTR